MTFFQPSGTNAVFAHMWDMMHLLTKHNKTKQKYFNTSSCSTHAANIYTVFNSMFSSFLIQILIFIVFVSIPFLDRSLSFTYKCLKLLPGLPNFSHIPDHVIAFIFHSVYPAEGSLFSPLHPLSKQFFTSPPDFSLSPRERALQKDKPNKVT